MWQTYALLFLDFVAMIMLFIAWYRGGEQVELSSEEHKGIAISFVAANVFIVANVLMNFISDVVFDFTSWFEYFFLIAKRLTLIGYAGIASIFYLGGKFRFVIPIYRYTGKYFYEFIKKVLYG